MWLFALHIGAEYGRHRNNTCRVLGHPSKLLNLLGCVLGDMVAVAGRNGDVGVDTTGKTLASIQPTGVAHGGK